MQLQMQRITKMIPREVIKMLWEHCLNVGMSSFLVMILTLF